MNDRSASKQIHSPHTASHYPRSCNWPILMPRKETRLLPVLWICTVPLVLKKSRDLYRYGAYCATHLMARSFDRTTHSLCGSALLILLARSALLNRSLIFLLTILKDEEQLLFFTPMARFHPVSYPTSVNALISV